ncbi:hypothetical protein AVEN_238108-1 [Araneus ventricosus]|uniref:Uncharacterized protein n=1 Tax=Araneus ventricosus TaxID=182803 RepID=A0A4Y2GEM3_ARAVE|nr:hypothetical protein AVEN_238108-1 [Araneus ventricosus]
MGPAPVLVPKSGSSHHASFLQRADTRPRKENTSPKNIPHGVLYAQQLVLKASETPPKFEILCCRIRNTEVDRGSSRCTKRIRNQFSESPLGGAESAIGQKSRGADKETGGKTIAAARRLPTALHKSGGWYSFLERSSPTLKDGVKVGCWPHPLEFGYQPQQCPIQL